MRSLTVLLLAGIVALAGCNTIEGAGRDVESVGQVFSNDADGAK